tara:strand:- start:2645 stop:2845 length:201 start_codon:yes stop_codon:yes gene_type:complete
MPKHTKMKSKMGAKNGNKAARRGRKMMGSTVRKPMMGGGSKKTKGYARGGVVNPSYSGDMPTLTPN